MLGPSFKELISILPILRQGVLQPLVLFSKRYGPNYCIKFLGQRHYIFSAPDQVHEILLEKSKSFHKNYGLLQKLLGEGILTADGEFWKQQRKIINPLFMKSSHGHFAQVIREEFAHFDSKQLRRPWVQEEMLELSLQIISRVIFSEIDPRTIRIVKNTVEDFQTHFVKSFRALIPLPFATPRPSYFRFRRSLAEFDSFLKEKLKEREKKSFPDLLQILLEARLQNGDALSFEQIRDEITTMIMAGHETTAHHLTWTLMLLADHQEVQRELRDELVQGQTSLLKNILRESLRLYPPIWYVERKAIENVKIGTTDIPKGSKVGLCLYLTHHASQLWESPGSFLPKRFEQIEEIRKKRCYLPFGAGTRVCIGAGLAELEAEIIIAEIIKKYKIARSDSHSIDVDPLVTLRPKKDFQLEFSPVE